ncbi:MAG TPA: hypothetical protein VKB23_01695 [Solirubrobacterales bacterium]|nr:hypothetical protein [Solirubrobacterales bacterium]
MTPKKARRPQSGMTWFALALGALALLAMPSLAAAKDRNHDHIPDRWEKRHKLSLTVNQARHDQDGDHLRNRGEFLAGDDPRDRDSDDDGVMDGSEQAGTIDSFDAGTGRLVIDLFGTDTISGLVTDATEIECEDSSSASVSSDGSGSGEAEPGDDDGGEGEVEPGDDNGGHGDEPGDDNGGDDQGDEDSGSSHEGEDNSGPGSESSGPGHDGDDDHGDRLCTTAALVPGAVVEEAELKIENGQATFEEVELSGKEVSDS